MLDYRENLVNKKICIVQKENFSLIMEKSEITTVSRGSTNSYS